MKKGQVSTDTPIILSILVFQAFILVCFGFLNIAVTQTNNSSVEMNMTGVTTANSFFSFGNIIDNIEILGWGNLLLFAPLELCLGYIIAKLIRGGG